MARDATRATNENLFILRNENRYVCRFDSSMPGLFGPGASAAGYPNIESRPRSGPVEMLIREMVATKRGDG